MSRIEVKGISKSFGDTVALDNVSVNFESGKIYGLLGRNGAGKSTLLNIISNRLFADAGTVFVDGEPAIENDRAESKLYLMSEKNYYPEEMKVKEVLKWTKEFYGDYFDMESAESMAEIFKLDLNKKTSKLSTGYKSIYKVVTALNLNTPYLFLDEPVLGLDANHRDLFYDLLLK